MTDETGLAIMAFAVYAASSVRMMDSMPAALALGSADFGMRTPIRAGRRRLYMPNPMRPDVCLIERPRSGTAIREVRKLAHDLIPFQIAATLSAACIFVGLPVLVTRLPLLQVFLSIFTTSGFVVFGAFAASAMRNGTGLDRSTTIRLLAAAIISPPVAGNLARDVVKARQCRS